MRVKKSNHSKSASPRFWFSILLVGILYVGSHWFYTRNYEVPILMYHQVEPRADESALNVRPDYFERQMALLKKMNRQIIPLETLVQKIKNNEPIPYGTVAITFDDGEANNYEYAYPILEKYQMPATFFVITDNIDEPGWLTKKQLIEMDQSIMDIGSHTVTHAFLPKLDPSQILREVTQSKEALESILQRPVTLFSYPAGGVHYASLKAVEEAGYLGAVTTNHAPGIHQPYLLHRIKIKESSANPVNLWFKTSGFYHLGKSRIPLDKPTLSE